jgi:hypothetical protein
LQKDVQIYIYRSLKLLAVHEGIGHVTMALSLFASANKMKGVVRGEVDFFRLLKFLGLNQGVLYILYGYWAKSSIPK